MPSQLTPGPVGGGDVAGARLGELLVRDQMISVAQLKEAQAEQRETGQRLGYSLTKLGYIQESDLTQFLSRQYGVPPIDLSTFEIDPEVSKLVPEDVCRRHTVIPVNRTGASLIVAMSDPANILAIEANGASVWAQQSRRDVDERTFTRAIFAD